MTDILCTWLNDELHISKRITPATVASDFASGYLLGEVLYKYQLQDDFDQFSSSRTSESKLNNFTRVEPMLQLLGIPFDTTVARDIMTEKHGTATQLLYQMYIALNNKKKASLTQVAMQTLQPAAPAKLSIIESDMFKQRLKQTTQRQTDLDLQALIDRFNQHKLRMEQKSFKEKFEESERLHEERQQMRQCLLERSRKFREKQSEFVAKINAATVQIPQPPASHMVKALEVRKELRRKREAEETIYAIHEFEEKLKAILPPSEEGISFGSEYVIRTVDDQKDHIYYLKMTTDDEYIGKIHKRLQEDATAREEREKRRRKVLNDQIRAHQAQEEAKQEAMLVNRLLRQSQYERRIAVQLLQARHEKEVIRQNRIFREQQYQERREKDYQDAMDREAEMAALRKLQYAEQIKADQEIHRQIAHQRAQLHYQRHYNMCAEIVNSILDFACNVAEYRELTNNLIPAKLMREWKLLFVNGQPLYDHVELPVLEISAEQVLEEERQQLLDEGDFMEYRDMTGEWSPPEESDIKEPPHENPVIIHILQKLFSLAHPPTPLPLPPEFPAFPIRACVLGKAFSGKTTCLTRLSKENNLQILDPEKLVQEAVEAFKAREVETAEQEVQADLSEPVDDAASTQQKPHSEKNTPEINRSSISFSNNAVTPATAGDEQLEQENLNVSDDAEVALLDNLELPEAPAIEEKPKYAGPQLTVRAQLGEKALKFLRKGLPVDDQVMSEILAEAIRKIPEGTGWILDGYPRTYNQAKLLEKVLSGCDVTATENKNKEFKKQQKNSLVNYQTSSGQPPTPKSGIDVAILFDIRDELCFKRAAGRYEQVQAEKLFHEEFNPPPVGSATGVGKVEKVQPVSDPFYDQQQIHTRITGFLDNWPKIQKWFMKFGNLKTVDASLEKETIFLETEKILEDTLAMIKQRDQEEVLIPKVQSEVHEAPGGPPENISAEQAVEEPAPGGPDIGELRPISKSGSRSGTEEGAKTEVSKVSKETTKTATEEAPVASSSIALTKHQPEVISDTDDKTVSQKQEADVEFNLVISVAIGQTTGKKKSETSKPHEPEPEPEVPEGPPPIKPGDVDWIFAEFDIDRELALVLMSQWEEMEKVYVNNLKTVFRNIRGERENIFRYIFQIRKDFIMFLQKPDCKQEYVSQWQKAYNQVADDLRDDEEVKAELHQQVDDLVEKLWEICDERKVKAEAERLTVMKDEWLSDRLGMLTNHYLTIMQAEVDRFQDTVRLLKDYYHALNTPIPDSLNPHYERVPLIELHFEKPEKPETEKVVSEIIIPEDKISEKDGKFNSFKKRVSDKDGEKLENHSAEKIGNRIIIPLVPQHTSNVVPDAERSVKVSGRESREKNVTKKGKDDPELQSDIDSRDIYEGCTYAVNAVTGITEAEMTQKELEEEAEKLREFEKEKEKERVHKNVKPAKGGKKAARSPSPKKTSKAQELTPSTTQVVSTDDNEQEVVQAKLQRTRAREELYFAIGEEAHAALTRLELVRLVGCAVLQDLKQRALDAFNAMNDWLGTKFLKEMASIDQMALVMGNAIEQGEKIKYELILETDTFLMDEDLKILKSPSPEPPPTPVEEPMANYFTVEQLKNLYEQLRAIAPAGIISKKTFTDMFENLISVTPGTETLPEQWMQLTSGQIQELSNALSCDSDYINWHSLLVALCYPLPTPTQQQLLKCLQNFKNMDQKNSGTVTREQWHWIKLWFTSDHPDQNVYDRVSNLKKLLFEMFADHSGPISVLDYVSFLMYFSVAANYYEGFLRALSVATGQHMPRLPKSLLPLTAQERKVQSGHAIEGSVGKEEQISAEPPMSDEVIPPEAYDAEVSLEALYKVLHHTDIYSGDGHRFCATADPEDHRSIERLTAVFQELNDDDSTAPIMYRVLIEHPLIQDVVVACKQFKAVDIMSFISQPTIDITEIPSLQSID